MKRFLLFVAVIIGACTCYLAFREWLLHHSYHLRLTKTHLSEALLYSQAAIDRNRGRIRRWIERDIGGAEYLDELCNGYTQMNILSGFGEDEDLEILWNCAGRVLKPRSGQEHNQLLVNRQSLITNNLAICIVGFYLDNRRGGRLGLESELDVRTVAPEVRDAIEMQMARFFPEASAIP